MIRLIIFLLLLSTVSYGQGRSTFGAGRAQDTSYTLGQVKFTAYGGSLDTMLLIVLPNGNVKKAPFNGAALSAGYGLVEAGGAANVDTTIFFKNGGNDFGISTGVLGSTTGSLDIIAANDTRLLVEANSIKVFNVDSFLIHDDGALRAGHIISDAGVKFSAYPSVTMLGTDETGELVRGFSPPFVYNVVDYGATPNDSTDDDGPAIMAAIADRAGIAITYNATRDTVTWVKIQPRVMTDAPIYFPAGIYHVSSPLIKKINNHIFNGQLFIPNVNINTDSSTEITYKLLGPTEASFLESAYADIRNADAKNGAIVKSTLLNDGSQFPSIIAVEGGDSSYIGSFPVYTGNQQVISENMHWRVEYGTGGAQLCAFDAFAAEDFQWISSRADYDTSGFNVPMTTNRVFGVRGPMPFTGTVASYRGGLVSGFYDGIVSGEHTHLAPSMHIFMCENAVNQMVNAHFAYFEYPTIQWCKNLVKTGGYGIHSAQPATSGADIAYILGGIKAEKFCSGTYAEGIDVVDSSNILSGNIRFMALRSGCFPVVYQQFGTRINATRLTIETPIDDQSVNHRNFGIVYSGADSTRWGPTYRNVNSLGTTNIFISNNRASLASYGGLFYGGSAATTTIGGKSRADRFFVLADGASTTGIMSGTTTNDSVDFIQNNIIRGGINTSGNWWYSTNVALTGATSILSIGNSTPLSTSTPTTIDMGGTFADAATSAKAKWKLYNDGTASNTYAIGISNQQFNFFTNSTGAFKWHWADVERFAINSSGKISRHGTSIPNNGQLLIGDGTEFELATITAGTGIDVTNGAGTITLATNGNATVTTSSAGTLSPSSSGHYVFTGATSTWTLPSVSGTSGRVMFIKNRGSGTVTINTTASANEIYSNAAVNTYALTAGSAIILVSDGVMWNVE